MDALTVALRLVHVVLGVYWAGSIFFFATFLEPVVKSLGPDGGKVMMKLFERGYLTVLPIAAGLTVVSGFWLLWLLSAGFDSAWMGSTVGMALSTGGLLASIAFILGVMVMRPAALRLWAIARQLPGLTEETARKERTTEMERLRGRISAAARVIFAMLVASVALMAVARYL